MLVAYRDGFTDPMTLQLVGWKMATPSQTVDISVKGAYSIAVVCMLDANTVLTWQGFHTVDDDIPAKDQPPTVTTGCQPPAAVPPVVTGKLQQKGTVHIGDADAQTATTAPFNFSVQLQEGTYDLVATTANDDPSTNKTLIQHAIAVPAAGGDIGTFDVSTGAAQMPLGIVLGNPPNPDKSTEKVFASVEVTTKNNAGPATISTATYDLKNKKVAVFALPKGALGDGDTQSATFTGNNVVLDADDKPTGIITTRSITMPFTLGDDTASGKSTFSLPAGINIPGWGMDKARLSVALPALPALDDLTIQATGKAVGSATVTAKYEINITSTYFAVTALARPVFDTDIPNFQNGWKIDFNQAYSRTITSQRDAFTKGVFVDHETSQFTEEVTP